MGKFLFSNLQSTNKGWSFVFFFCWMVTQQPLWDEIGQQINKQRSVKCFEKLAFKKFQIRLNFRMDYLFLVSVPTFNWRRLWRCQYLVQFAKWVVGLWCSMRMASSVLSCLQSLAYSTVTIQKSIQWLETTSSTRSSLAKFKQSLCSFWICVLVFRFFVYVT